MTRSAPEKRTRFPAQFLSRFIEFLRFLEALREVLLPRMADFAAAELVHTLRNAVIQGIPGIQVMPGRPACRFLLVGMRIQPAVV